MMLTQGPWRLNALKCQSCGRKPAHSSMKLFRTDERISGTVLQKTKRGQRLGGHREVIVRSSASGASLPIGEGKIHQDCLKRLIICGLLLF